MKAMELEHDPRLARILATRRVLFGVQGVIVALFAFYVMIVNGLSLAPLFFPVYNVVLVGALILFIVAIERIFFFRLCIVYGKRNGAKFLIAKNRFRGSLALLAVGFVVSLLLITLTFTPTMNLYGTASGGIGTVEFQSNNLFALGTVDTITISNLGINNLTFVIVSAADYYATNANSVHANETALMLVSLNQGNDFVSPAGTTTATVLTAVNTNYFIVIFSNSGSVRVNYILGMKAMPSMFYALLLSFASLPISAYLAVYARIQMRRLRSSTIFT